MMPDRLEKIVESIKYNKNDKEGFAERALHFLKSEEFWDESNNYEFLREYIKDTLEFHLQEIEYHKKYSPSVFHKNTYRSLQFEDEVWQQILDKLNNQ